MGYSHLLNTEVTLPSFRTTYNIPRDVDIAYCHEVTSLFNDALM